MSLSVLSGLIILVLLVIMLIAGVPIAVALGISSVCAILPVMDLNVAVVTGAQRIFSGISVFSLLAIPFFILAGNIMNKGGIAIRLINLAKIVTGRTPGGLAQTNILANALFGAISGSGTAAASAMGSIIGPIEKDEGYDPNFSAAANIATAPTGLLIPPSNVMITFSLVSGGTSVAALFMAGYIPGILWGVSVMVVAYILAKKNNYTVKRDKLTAKIVGKVLWDAIPSLSLIVIILGGILGGIFTATEAAAIAVVYSFLLAFVFYRTIKLRDIKGILMSSVQMTGTIIFLIAASSIMSWVLAFTNIPTIITEFILGISSSKVLILLAMNILLLVVGTFMDLTPAILIFTPILLPIAQNFGMDTVQFGIMLVFNLCIGNITPPVGNTLFVGCKVGKTKIENVIKHMLPFYVAIVTVLMLVTFIPQISLFIPNILGL